MKESAQTTKQSEEKNEKVEDVEVEADATPVKQTRSIILAGFGGPKYVRLQSKDQRSVKKGEVAIEIEACGIGFLDVMSRQGLLETPCKPPFVMGSECCGKVTEIGEGVTKYKVGDEVVALCEYGAWTERLVVSPISETEEISAAVESTTGEEAKPPSSPTTNLHSHPAVLFLKPANMSSNQAATFAMSYLPAYLLLHKVAFVRPGDVVLVHSAGGGVGTAIGQLVKLIGDVKLIGTASANKHKDLNDMYSQLINHSQDYVAEVKKENPLGVSVVLDCRSGEDTSKSLSLLNPMGRYVIYGSSNFVTGDRKNVFNFAKFWIQMDRISPLRLLEENKSLGGFSMKSMIFRQHIQPKIIFDAWQELSELFLKNKINPIVDSEWSFEEVKEAMQKLQDRSNIGKVVISPKLKPKVPEPEKPANSEPAVTEPATNLAQV